MKDATHMRRTAMETLLFTLCVIAGPHTVEVRYRIAGIIRGGQFSREGEAFVLQGLFAGLKFADPIPPLCFARGPYSPAMFRGFIFRG